MRPILYIAGPYSATADQTVAENIGVARQHAISAAKRGWMPLTPHLNSAHFEKDCPRVLNREWILGYISILKCLDPKDTAVLLLPGWRDSKGAKLERAWALHLGFKVFDPPPFPDAVVPAKSFLRCCR